MNIYRVTVYYTAQRLSIASGLCQIFDADQKQEAEDYAAKMFRIGYCAVVGSDRI